MNKRPYLMWYDGSGDLPVQQQVDDPLHLQFAPQAATSPRSILGSDGNSYTVADGAVNVRGAKNIVWSSEGYSSLGNSITGGLAVPPLSANQKKATGSLLSATTGNQGTLFGATPPPLDFSAYRSLVLMVNVVSLTGGSSPSIQFELDFQDDTATPVSFPIWKPTALSAAGSLLVMIGASVPFAQAAAAPSLAPTNFGVIAVPSGWTYYPLPFPVLPNGNFQWTVTGAPTAIAWSTWIYGIN
jgi:hypothetical protein